MPTDPHESRPLGEEERRELEELIAAATPGPWLDGHTLDPDARSREIRGVAPGWDEAWEHASEPVGVIDSTADALLIVALRNAAPSLLAAAEENTRLREALRLTEEEQRAYDDWRHITRHGNVPSVIVLLDALDRLGYLVGAHVIAPNEEVPS